MLAHRILGGCSSSISVSCPFPVPEVIEKGSFLCKVFYLIRFFGQLNSSTTGMCYYLLEDS